MLQKQDLAKNTAVASPLRCCSWVGREAALSGASTPASRPWDAAVATAQGHARLLLTPVETQDNVAGVSGVPRAGPDPRQRAQTGNPAPDPSVVAALLEIA